MRRTGRSGNLTALELTPSSSGGEALYRKHLGLSPRTDGLVNVLTFSRAVLDAASALADSETHQSVIAACAEKAQSRLDDSTVKDLNLSPRQLRALLQRDRTNYHCYENKGREVRPPRVFHGARYL